LHLDDLRHMSFNFLARKIHLRASVVFDDVHAIAIASYFLCGGRRCKDSFEGLPRVRSLWSYFMYDEPEAAACF